LEGTPIPLSKGPPYNKTKDFQVSYLKTKDLAKRKPGALPGLTVSIIWVMSRISD
jgi:hypothetical protein